MKSSENQIEKDTDDNGSRLQLLIQYYNGKARKVIESCVLLDQEEGYNEAKRDFVASIMCLILGSTKYQMAHQSNPVIEKHLWIWQTTFKTARLR